MKLGKGYTSGLINLVFLAEANDSKVLLDTLFDTVVMRDSATGRTVELEIATLDIEDMVLLGEDEQDDLKLA